MQTIRKFFSNPWRKLATFASLGAMAGYAYYAFVGCASGSCPISSNPYVSTLYGLGMGAVLGFEGKTKTRL